MSVIPIKGLKLSARLMNAMYFNVRMSVIPIKGLKPD